MRNLCYSLYCDTGSELVKWKLFWPTVAGYLVFLTGSFMFWAKTLKMQRACGVSLEVLSINFVNRSRKSELTSVLHLNCCSARLLVYRRNELYLAWLETWDSALSTVEMLVEKLPHCEALPQGEITFGPPTSNSCGATSANVVVSQPRSFSSSAWLQSTFWVLWNRHGSNGVC